MIAIALPWPPRCLHPNSCRIDGCEKPHKSQGLCYMHLRRWQRHGDSLKTAKTPNGDPMLFLLHHALTFSSKDCLPWPHAKDEHGYPMVRKDGRRSRAHRILCEAAHGPQPSPEHKEVAHGCGHPWCVNPSHLRWATPKENQADRALHGTSNRGERQGQSKLTANDVLKIRELEGTISRRKIAEMFGVRSGAIDKIIRGQTWSWL